MGLKICPKCKKNLNGNKICSSCGENIEKYEKMFCSGCQGELVRCPRCKATLDIKYSKCPKCEYDIEKARTLICTYCDREQATQMVLSGNITQHEKKHCTYCGSGIALSDAFCPKCGKKVINEKRYCSKCGAVIYRGQRFCAKCGNIQLSLSRFVPDFKQRKNRLGSKRVAILIVLFLILIVDFTFLGKNYVAPMFVTTEQWLEEGNYEKAYNKAKEDEKQGVLIENLIAYLCKDDIDYMNDDRSFNIRKAWIDIDKGDLVLMIGGNNSFGASVVNLWYYTYQEDEGEYVLYTTIDDLDENDIYLWDDADDIVKKILDNYSKKRIRKTMQEQNIVDKKYLTNINKLAKSEKISEVELLDDVKSIYPNAKKNT